MFFSKQEHKQEKSVENKKRVQGKIICNGVFVGYTLTLMLFFFFFIKVRTFSFADQQVLMSLFSNTFMFYFLVCEKVCLGWTDFTPI